MKAQGVKDLAQVKKETKLRRSEELPIIVDNTPFTVEKDKEKRTMS